MFQRIFVWHCQIVQLIVEGRDLPEKVLPEKVPAREKAWQGKEDDCSQKSSIKLYNSSKDLDTGLFWLKGEASGPKGLRFKFFGIIH